METASTAVKRRFFSNSDYIASNVGVVSDELEGILKEAVVA
jgi:hypothetical protein